MRNKTASWSRCRGDQQVSVWVCATAWSLTGPIACHQFPRLTSRVQSSKHAAAWMPDVRAINFVHRPQRKPPLESWSAQSSCVCGFNAHTARTRSVVICLNVFFFRWAATCEQRRFFGLIPTPPAVWPPPNL